MFMFSDIAQARVFVALVLAVLLAGCGGSDNGVASKTSTEILAASRAAAESATSVHVLSKASQGSLSLTDSLQLAGNGGRAQISLLGLEYEVIRIGNTVYAKGNSAFYKHLRGAAAKLSQGTWLEGSVTDGQLAQLAELVDLHGELARLLSIGTSTKGAIATVNGQRAIELEQTAQLFKGSLYVATTGKPYPIELLKHGRETGQTTFTAWNEPISLSAPAHAVAIAANQAPR
jgi:hypothetical protein